MFGMILVAELLLPRRFATMLLLIFCVCFFSLVFFVSGVDDDTLPVGVCGGVDLLVVASAAGFDAAACDV